MDTVTLDRAVEVVRALGPEEQARLRAMMDSWQTPAPPEESTPKEATPAQERAFLEHLLAKGIIGHIPEGYPAGYVEPPTIVIEGEPLSETVLRERR